MPIIRAKIVFFFMKACTAVVRHRFLGDVIPTRLRDVGFNVEAVMFTDRQVKGDQKFYFTAVSMVLNGESRGLVAI